MYQIVSLIVHIVWTLWLSTEVWVVSAGISWASGKTWKSNMDSAFFLNIYTTSYMYVHVHLCTGIQKDAKSSKTIHKTFLFVVQTAITKLYIALARQTVQRFQPNKLLSGTTCNSVHLCFTHVTSVKDWSKNRLAWPVTASAHRAK